MGKIPVPQAASKQARDLENNGLVTSKEAVERGYVSDKILPPEPEKCKFCGQTLYYEGLVINGSVLIWMTQPERCRCKKAVEYWKKYDKEQEEKKAAEEKAKKQAEMNARIQRLIGKSGIKKRFMNRTFDNFIVNETNREAFEIAKRYADEFPKFAAEGKGLYFEGTFGTGKTHLAVAIALQLMNCNIPVICKTSIDLLNDIKRTFDSDYGSSEHQVLQVYKDVDLLIIDDLGKEMATEWSLATLYDILNDRYETMRPTIITTNYNDEALVARLTPRGFDNTNMGALMSRLKGTSAVVTMAWEDYRSGGY